MVLPHVVRYNSADENVRAGYASLAKTAGLCNHDTDDQTAARALENRLRELLEVAALPTKLSDCGIPATALEDLAAEASRQWTAQFNPRAVDAEQFRGLYTAAVAGFE